MLISKTSIENLKNQIDIVDIVSSFIELKNQVQILKLVALFMEKIHHPLQ